MNEKLSSCQNSNTVTLETTTMVETPLIQGIWKVFNFLDSQYQGIERIPRLNHSSDKSLIAFNLPQFVQMAASYNQIIPPMAVLKRTLRTSPKFKCIRSIKSAINEHNNNSQASEAALPRTQKYWVFQN